MITKRANGAEEEIEVVARLEAGAEVEAEAVYALKSGAEEEVWSAIKWLKMLEETLTVAQAGYGTMSGYDGMVWSVGGTDKNDGGYVTYYLEGDFTNPTIIFEYDGYYNYATTSGSDRYVSAGSISLYSRTTSGTESYKEVVSSVNTSEESAEPYSGTLSGNFDRIGFKIDLASWSGGDTAEFLAYDVSVWNFRIDGKECLPSADCIID